METTDKREWFTETVSGVAENSNDDIKAWNWAVLYVSRDGWREWVLGCVKEARGPRVRDPFSLLLSKLRGTKPKEAPKLKYVDKHLQGMTRSRDVDAHVERARLTRLNRPPTQPSSLAMAALRPTLGFFGAYQAVEAEWRAQGKPYFTEFNWLPLGLSQNPKLEPTDGKQDSDRATLSLVTDSPD